jgi:predicted metal-dependent enzyme (double-stranded beta helix superfamily)
MAEGIERLRSFIGEVTCLVDAGAGEPAILEQGAAALGALVAQDDWLPAEFAEPHPEQYRQYLLYCDPWERFSVVSFVWGPGQRTPIHDHTVWGLIGMLRGAELSRDYSIDPARGLVAGDVCRLEPGVVAAVSPTIGDIHTVENAFADRVSISIHVYGANIGAVARHVFVADTGAAKPFVSGYANRLTPNLWDRSTETRRRLGI